MMGFITEKKRSHTCGQLSSSNVGEKVVLMGWVDTRRDHGGLVFVDLRDRYGLTQVVLNPENIAQAHELRNEFVIAVEGKVNARPEGMQNTKMQTGDIELEAESCQILSAAETPPIQINDENVTENLRLKYRYLDLRSNKMRSNLQIRHKLCQLIRSGLNQQDFLEIETPILYKSTPEGARDYLVPSRVHPGSFYALPQSPQTLKQLLMVAGYDRYYQIARCFRDEDLRAERQPEFTQLDLEMSFVDVQDVLDLNEKLVKFIWQEMCGVNLEKFPVISYDEAMNRYGSDKPDIRFSMELTDLKQCFNGCEFKVFQDVIAKPEAALKAISCQGAASFSRGQMDKITTFAKKFGAKGLVWIKWEKEEEFVAPVAKFFTKDMLKSAFEKCEAQVGDAIFIVADEWGTTCKVLGELRTHLAKENQLIDTSKDAFLWVKDFPLLDYDADEKRWIAMHHPFTAVVEEQVHTLLEAKEEDFPKLKAKAYDLVCNGYEVGGGSIRIHNSKQQEAMFRALRISEEEAQKRFGFFIEALKYGTPPHGGIAWGIDRMAMILCRTEAIRDVIAFPKTAKAFDLMSDSPSTVDREQLLELGIRLK